MSAQADVFVRLEWIGARGFLLNFFGHINDFKSHLNRCSPVIDLCTLQVCSRARAEMPERVTDGHTGYTEQLRIPPPDIEELGLVLIPPPSYPLARIRVSHG